MVNVVSKFFIWSIQNCVISQLGVVNIYDFTYWVFVCALKNVGDTFLKELIKAKKPLVLKS